MQTISILVAEKQELQHHVHEARSSMNQELTSRQKYQDQLQDSKLRVQTLERELKLNSDSASELNEVRILTCMIYCCNELLFLPLSLFNLSVSFTFSLKLL